MVRIRLYRDSDLDTVVALWNCCGLLRPWNDPTADIALCARTAGSALFVGETRGEHEEERVVASVMTGSDGHRGWLYYLAVEPSQRHKGFARTLTRHAEAWLATQGINKVQLMIRAENEAVRVFYEKIGYAVEPRIVMSRWLR